MAYREESVFEFPWGLPAFEQEKRFVLIESPEHAPLVFLQSLADAGLCFLAFPILVVDRDYQLGITQEDLAALELDTERQPELGAEVLVLALLSLHDGFSATANLMAPIVIHLGTRRGATGDSVRFFVLVSAFHWAAERTGHGGVRASIGKHRRRVPLCMFTAGNEAGDALGRKHVSPAAARRRIAADRRRN